MDVIERLKMDEGFRQFPYRCTAGKLTIGFGRNIDPEGGRGISEGEATILLRHDLFGAEMDLKTVFPSWKHIDPVRQGALLNMRFQLGPGGFRSFKRMIEAVKKRDYPTAALEVRRSLYFMQVPERADRIRREIRDGIST